MECGVYKNFTSLPWNISRIKIFFDRTYISRFNLMTHWSIIFFLIKNIKLIFID